MTAAGRGPTAEPVKPDRASAARGARRHPAHEEGASLVHECGSTSLIEGQHNLQQRRSAIAYMSPVAYETTMEG